MQCEQLPAIQWTKVVIGIVVFASFFRFQSSRAQDAVPSARRTQLEAQSPRAKSLPDQGVNLFGGWTTEVFGNFAGGSSRSAIWENLLRIGLEIDLAKLAGWKGWSSHVSGLYPQGSSLTNEAVHDFNTLSNIDSYDSIRLYEAWLQGEMWEGCFSVRLGQILADAEFFASEYGALFINSSFGAIPLVSQNLSPPIFPVAAPGLRLRSDVSDSFYVEAALFSGDVGNPGTTNKHNTRVSFRSEDGVLVFAEIGYKLHSREDSGSSPVLGEAPLSGTYKLGGFYDSKEFTNNGAGPPHRGNFSIYLIADQELWHPSGRVERTLSFFARLGGAPRDRNTVTFYADTGLNFKGLLANRVNDTLGLGFSYTRLSSELVDDSGRTVPSHYEAVLELTYLAALTDHVSLQPDLQVIFNPGAAQPAPTAVVSGLRCNIEF